MKIERRLLKTVCFAVKAKVTSNKGFVRSPGYYHMPKRPKN